MNSLSKVMLLLLVLVLLQVQVSYQFTSTGKSTNDGVSPDRYPSYYRVNGTNGIKFLLDNRQGGRLDYFLRMWIRPQFLLKTGYNQTYTFLDIQGSLKCYFSMTNTSLICGQMVSDTYQTAMIAMNVSDIYPQTWVHFALGGAQGSNFAYMQLDYNDQMAKHVNSTYLPVIQNLVPWNAFVGINSNLTQGFLGDVREFYFNQGYTTPLQIKNIRNQVIFWNYAQLANYRMQKGDLSDITRFTTFGTLVSVVNTSLPAWAYDNLPVDVCNRYTSYTVLPRLNMDAMSFNTGQIDSRLTPQAYFQYSGSFWMRTLPGIRTTTSTQQGRDNFYFFRLLKAFSLWFNDATTIRMYFESTKSFLEAASDGIYFPLGFWANFQFQIDRQIGYEMRVYNAQREEISRTTKKIYLYEQSPQGQFTLLRNFQGYVKQIMVWCNMQTLPIEISNGWLENWRDNSIIIYYKFDQQQWQGSSIPSLGYNAGGAYGPTVGFNGALNWEIVEWESNTPFNSPLQIGKITQPYSMYDGVGCSDSNPVYRFSGQNSFLNQTLPAQNKDLTEVTVEFWMKRQAQMPKTLNFLFQLYLPQYGTEYMNIYQATDDVLYCSPMEMSRNLTVRYYNYTVLQAWQHVSCKFMQGYEIVGGLYVTQNETEFYYKTDLSGAALPQVIPNATINMIIGGRYSQQFGQANTMMKDVRFWTVSRTIQQLTRFRFTQIDPSSTTNLLAYFKFIDGSYDQVNYVNYSSNTAAIKVNGQGYDLDSSPSTLCPQHSFALNKSSCLRNPYLKHKLIIAAQPNDSNTTTWLVSSRHSNFVSMDVMTRQDSFMYEWTSDNARINNELGPLFVNKTNIQLPNNITSSKTDVFTIKQSVNNGLRTFYDDANITFSLNPCVYVIDVNSKSPITERFVYASQGQQDIIHTFKVYDNCTNNTQKVSKIVIDWEVLHPTLNFTNFTWRYETGLDSFTFLIPKENQYTLPANEFVNFIATLYWVESLQETIVNTTVNGTNTTTIITTNTSNTNASNIRQSLTYLNLIYKIKFVEPMRPLLAFPIDQILIGEPLILNSTTSYSMNVTNETERTYGLDYYWGCPDIMNASCAKQQNRKLLNISYDDFLAGKASYNNKYNFTVSVVRGTDLEPPLYFNLTVSALWLQVYRPDFLINLQAPQTKVLASKDAIFMLELKNYVLNDPLLNLTWTLTPAPNNQSLFFAYSTYNDTLTIKKGALKSNTTYTLSVFAQNKNYLFANRTVNYTFMTGMGPANGSTLISPLASAGTALSTVFTFAIANWNSLNMPIRYQVYGISDGLSTPFLLTSRPYFQNESFITVLPLLKQVRFEVADATDEVVAITTEVQMYTTPNPYVNITGMNESSSLDQLVLQAYQIFQMDQSANAQTIQSNKLSSFNYLLNMVGTYNASNDNITVANSQSMKKAVQILALIANGSQSTTDQIQSQASAILTMLQNRPNVLQYCLLTDQSFQQNYATAVSNLMKYYFTKAISQSKLRFLQSTATASESRASMMTSLKYKNDYADTFCKSINSTYYEVQFTVDTDLFTMIIEKIPIKSRAFNRTYLNPKNYSTFIMLPINEIVANEYAVNNSISTTCVQVTFYKQNPLQTYNFTDQNLTQLPIMQVNTLNDNNVKLLENSTLKLSKPLLYFQQSYNYNDTANYFRNNQTVGQYMESYVTDYSKLRWKDTTCESKYDYRSMLMFTSCSEMKANYYTINNDYQRTFFDPNAKTWIENLIALILAFDPAVIPVFIFILVFIVVMPIVAICKDRSDYEAIKSDEYEVDDDVVRKMALFKRQPFEQVLYNKKLYAQYQNTQISCMNLFVIYFKNIHPFFSLFWKFDITLKRLIRFMGLTYQVCICAIVSTLVFGLWYRADDFDDKTRNDIYDLTDITYAAALGLFLSLVTLPLPNCLASCCRSRLVAESQLQREQSESQPKVSDRDPKVEEEDDEVPAEKSNQDEVVSSSSEQDKKKKKKREYEGGERESRRSRPNRQSRNKYQTDDNQADGVKDQEDDFHDIREIQENAANPHTLQRLKSQEEVSYSRKKDYNDDSVTNHQIDTDLYQVDDPVVAIDKCVCLKLFLMIFAFLLAICTVLFVALISAQIPKANSRTITISFYLSLIFGWFLTNILRVIINALLVPLIVQDKQENEGRNGACCGCVASLVACEDSIQMLQDMIILYDLQYNAEKNDDKSQNYALRSNNKELTVDQFHTHNQGHTPDEEDVVQHIHDESSQPTTRREIKTNLEVDMGYRGGHMRQSYNSKPRGSEQPRGSASGQKEGEEPYRQGRRNNRKNRFRGDTNEKEPSDEENGQNVEKKRKY